MFLSVKELELKTIRFDVTYQPGEIDFGEAGLKQITPLTADGSAELLGNTLGEIRVTGSLDVTMESECDRCLEAARFPIHSKYDLFYRPADEDWRERVEETEIDAGEAEIAFYNGGGLDLTEILREHVLLSMPMQRICRTDCHGICPECGQNRNLVNCGCEAVKVDDRWSALRNIKEEVN